MKSGKKTGCGRIFRNLVFCIIFAVLLPVSAAENGKTVNSRISPIYREQIAQAVRDYQAWKKNDLCVCFPVITDLHTNLVTTDPRNCQQRGDTFDLNEYCLLDLVAVKLEKREIRIFRAGAGGFNFHRGAKF